MLRRQLLLIPLAGLLSACGFRLKGQKDNALILETPVRLHIPAQEKDNERVIRDAFASRGINFDDTATTGYDIVLDEFVNTRFESAVGGQHGQSRVLDVRMGFTATIRRNGATIARQPIFSERSLNYHSEQYLGSVAEDENAQRTMRRDNAEKLLRFFQATVSQP